MTEPQKKNLRIGVVVTALVLCAILARVAGLLQFHKVATGLLRSGIYIGLLAAWGVSVRLRIVQTQVRRYLTAISLFMVFWMAERTAKYFFVTDWNVGRHLWYGYYFPMLFIPLLAVFVSFSLGKPENFRLPRWTTILYLPTTLSFFLVLTNDLHQWVFTFTSVASLREANADGYEWGYYLAVGWMMLCTVTALVTMSLKCRIPRSKKVLWLPLLPVFFSLVYGVLYVTQVPWLRTVLGDMTAFQCVMYTAVFECCIQCGLIQSNMDYDALFAATTIRAQIADPALQVTASSASAQVLSKATMQQAVEKPFRLDENTLLKSHSIRDGYVFWQEDISELSAVLAQLQETQAELRDTGDILKAETEQAAHWLKLTEENRLYDLMEQQTAPQIARLRQLLQQLQETDSLAEAKGILGQIVVIGTYVKRRNNLIFITSQKQTVEAGELRLCLNESLTSLELYGVQCAVTLQMEGALPVSTATGIYDLFEAVVEVSLPTLSHLLLYGEDTGTAIQVNLVADCDTDLTVLCSRFPQLELEQDEDGIWYLTRQMERGRQS